MNELKSILCAIHLKLLDAINYFVLKIPHMGRSPYAISIFPSIWEVASMKDSYYGKVLFIWLILENKAV